VAVHQLEHAPERRRGVARPRPRERIRRRRHLGGPRRQLLAQLARRLRHVPVVRQPQPQPRRSGAPERQDVAADRQVHGALKHTTTAPRLLSHGTNAVAMAEIAPFRGILYTKAAGEPSKLLAPPYDVISDAERAQLETL